MNTSSHLYEGMSAELYDDWFGNHPHEDQLFYEHHLKKNGGKSLEIGSGTGRLLLAYLQEGLDVHGLEPSSTMLNLCFKKAQSLNLTPIMHRQSMQTLNVPFSYNTIFIPQCTFQLIVDPHEMREALRKAYLHLTKNGELLIPLFIPPLENLIHSYTPWHVNRSTTHPDGLSKVVVSEASQYDRLQQLETKWVKYEIYRDNESVHAFQRVTNLRWYYHREFMSILKDVGFRTTTVYGDYTQRQASSHHRISIFAAKK